MAARDETKTADFLEQPPQPESHKLEGTWVPIVKMAYDNPGRWIKIGGRWKPQTVQYLKRRYGLEAVSRAWDKTTNTSDIYARWNPPADGERGEE